MLDNRPRVTATDHSITTERGRLFARVWVTPGVHFEAGATILLFHDSLGSVELWRDFPQRLAAATGRQVVAYDRLGFGRSDTHPGPLAPSFIRDEALMVVPRLLDAFSLKAIVPFGHSVGGAMAIATAAYLPQACPAVISESALSFIEDRSVSGIRAAKNDFAQPGQVDRLARYHGSKARWVLDAWTETWLSPCFAHWTLDNELQCVQCPSLALHGQDDAYGSPEQPARIARLTRGPSRTVILEGCGHIPHREQPERVLSEVTRFLLSASLTSSA